MAMKQFSEKTKCDQEGMNPKNKTYSSSLHKHVQTHNNDQKTLSKEVRYPLIKIVTGLLSSLHSVTFYSFIHYFMYCFDYYQAYNQFVICFVDRMRSTLHVKMQSSKRKPSAKQKTNIIKANIIEPISISSDEECITAVLECDDVKQEVISPERVVEITAVTGCAGIKEEVLECS